MEQVTIITSEQQRLLEEFKKDTFLSANFYFTGGTALSMYYLKHRESIDLDFFSEKQFDPQTVLIKTTSWVEKYNASLEYIPSEDTHIFNIAFPNGQIVKVDFAFYPYKRVDEKNRLDGIFVDSLQDIAINKLLVAEQRAEVKDFVDLYFLLDKFTVWDLIEGVKVKFRIKLDPFIVSASFLKVEEFEYLPKMIKPLTLEELKSFFKKKAQKMGNKTVG